MTNKSSDIKEDDKALVVISNASKENLHNDEIEMFDPQKSLPPQNDFMFDETASVSGEGIDV